MYPTLPLSTAATQLTRNEASPMAARAFLLIPSFMPVIGSTSRLITLPFVLVQEPSNLRGQSGLSFLRNMGPGPGAEKQSAKKQTRPAAPAFSIPV